MADGKMNASLVPALKSLNKTKYFIEISDCNYYFRYW